MQLATTLSQIVQNAAITIAVIVGGLWALFRYRWLREDRLSVEFSSEVITNSPSDTGANVVSLVFRMRNAGARGLRLALDGTPPFDVPIQTRAEGEPHEKKAYRNCELKLWRLSAPQFGSDALISMLDLAQATEIRLAKEPVNVLAENRVSPNSFWLEPMETATLVVNLGLAPGFYAGAVWTIFDMPPITPFARKKKYKYTFDTFSFTFEVPGAMSPGHELHKVQRRAGEWMDSSSGQ